MVSVLGFFTWWRAGLRINRESGDWRGAEYQDDDDGGLESFAMLVKS
jgi:hypothetical protein